jgi:hypothetical protein
MPNEQHYTSHLVSIEEARERLPAPEVYVVEYAWQTWLSSLSIEKRRQEQRRPSGAEQAPTSDLFVPAQM